MWVAGPLLARQTDGALPHGAADGTEEHTMDTSGIRDWGDAVMTSLTGALAMLMAAVPRIIGFLVILAVGWIVAGLIARGIAALLRAVRFDEVARRAGFADVTRKMGMRTDSSGVIALIAKWFIRLITLVVAFDALGLPAVSDVLRQLLLWVPNLAVAVVILVIAGVVASALAAAVRGATAKAGVARPGVLAAIVRVAVMAFGVLVALNQIGVATSLINTLFTAVVGAFALAIGLAFGLGGRDTAARIVGRWYETAQRTGPALASQMDEAYARLEAEQSAQQPRFVEPMGWSGIERRRGWDPSYSGVERRRGMA